MPYDLNTPEGRFHAAEALGADGYNRAMREKFAKNTVKTVNGYPLRWVVSARWGTICMVDGANCGFTTLEGAEAHARSLPPQT